MSSLVKWSISRSIFLLSPFFLGIWVVGIIFLVWGIVYGVWNMFWWIVLMMGNIFLIIWYFLALVFFSWKIFFDEESFYYVDVKRVFSPQKKSLFFKDITKVTFEQKWFFAHVFWFGTLWLHTWEEKIWFSYIQDWKKMTGEIVDHLKNYS